MSVTTLPGHKSLYSRCRSETFKLTKTPSPVFLTRASSSPPNETGDFVHFISNLNFSHTPKISGPEKSHNNLELLAKASTTLAEKYLTPKQNKGSLKRATKQNENEPLAKQPKTAFIPSYKNPCPFEDRLEYLLMTTECARQNNI